MILEVLGYRTKEQPTLDAYPRCCAKPKKKKRPECSHIPLLLPQRARTCARISRALPPGSPTASQCLRIVSEMLRVAITSSPDDTSAVAQCSPGKSPSCSRFAK